MKGDTYPGRSLPGWLSNKQNCSSFQGFKVCKGDDNGATTDILCIVNLFFNTFIY